LAYNNTFKKKTNGIPAFAGMTRKGRAFEGMTRYVDGGERKTINQIGFRINAQKNARFAE
jgi:hypothetical protein